MSKIGSLQLVTLRAQQAPQLAFGKQKALAISGAFTGTFAGPVAFTKRKALALAGAWVGTNRAALALNKSKGVILSSSYSTAADRHLAFAKQKGLALAGTWSGTELGTLAFAKQKGLALAGSWSHLTSGPLAFGKTKGLDLAGVYTPGVLSQLRYAGLVVDTNIGGTNWVSPGFAQGPPDGTTTVTSITGITPQTNWLTATNYNFSIPVGAVIDSLTVTVYLFQSVTGAGNAKDWQVKLHTSSGTPGNDVASNTPLPLVAGTRSYSGNATYWGTSLNDSVINDNTNFGVILSYRSDGGPGIQTPNVDAIGITVVYH